MGSVLRGKNEGSFYIINVSFVGEMALGGFGSWEEMLVRMALG